MSDTPRHDLTYIPSSGSAQAQAIFNDLVNKCEAYLGGVPVETYAENDPPGSPSTFELHITGSTPTGEWAGHADEFAFYLGSNGWLFRVPRPGDFAFDKSSDTLYVRKSDNSWSSAAVLFASGGGLSLTNKTASYTALPNQHVVFNMSGAGAHFTLTLPASPTSGDKVKASLLAQSTDSQYVLLIDRNGGTINGTTDAAPFYLYLSGDSVEFEFNGTTWVAHRKVKAHTGALRSATAQSLSDGVLTTVAFDTEDWDQGGIAATSNDRLTARRAGRYQVTASWAATQASCPLDDGEGASLQLHISGSSTPVAVERRVAAAAGEDVYLHLCVVLDLTLGQYVELRVLQDSGAGGDTEDGASVQYQHPRLAMAEVL